MELREKLAILADAARYDAVNDGSDCTNRRSSNVRRARFTPEEVVWLTLEFHRRNYIDGLFPAVRSATHREI